MIFCLSCGNKINDNAKFCDSCGAKTSVLATAQEGGKHKLHCPECGGARLSAVVESTNEGGVAYHTAVTRRVGVTNYSSHTIHRNYWLCQECGTKFRNLQNLKAELADTAKKAKQCLILGAIIVAIALFCFILSSIEQIIALLLVPAGILALILGIVVVVVGLQSSSKVKSLTKEQLYLQSRCFR